ncbi:Acetolactate synthase large subunit [gamma proteobacterium HdN1]|nr:Acetolactate synthase large subunit [gamma proteobacterium HdN1]
MKKTGAWLVRYALEQLGIRYTFGIPGVHNTELYDELNNSSTITPVLVTHESGGSFMADAVSRVSDSIGCMVIVPAAGAAYASAGIGEAYLAGVPMLVICGGIRTDSQFRYQLHDVDQHAMMAPITRKTWRVLSHEEIVPTLYAAYELATQGEPGPVFVEVPVNLQLYTGEVSELPVFQASIRKPPDLNPVQVDHAVELLRRAKRPGIFVGWGAVDATTWVQKIADHLNAPVATTLQGVSAFPANHPLHTGMSFGPSAVPAAENAFHQCDVMLAVGTRFGEIATGSFGVKVPAKLIHVDINPQVLGANYPAKIALIGDASHVLEALWNGLSTAPAPSQARPELREQIRRDKEAYQQEWLKHDSGQRVNPARFFNGLRAQLKDDAIVVLDDGNHTFLAAELLPIHQARGLISPTDFNCMGYCIPATIAAKLTNRDKQVVGIVGDGAFMMTCMEIVTAATHRIGAIFFVFSDGELSQISQAQEIPYNRKTCTVLGKLDVSGVAKATGARFLALESNDKIEDVIRRAFALAGEGSPVLVDVNIDYSRRTRFTEGIVKTNLQRFPLNAKARFIGRALIRRVKV